MKDARVGGALRAFERRMRPRPRPRAGRPCAAQLALALLASLACLPGPETADRRTDLETRPDKALADDAGTNGNGATGGATVADADPPPPGSNERRSSWTSASNRRTSPLPPAALIGEDPVAYLRALDLLIPVEGKRPEELPPTNFADARGTRTHQAYDILAPRGTPVLAATGGHVAKLHVSEAGGNMVYTIDESERFVLFYAHLDRYQPGIHEGMRLQRGDTVGYVGTTGNAPPTAPHLHFGIVLMDEDRRWWKGAPIDPQPLLAREPR